MPLNVNNFGGGVVLAGAAGTRQISEVLDADSYDIGSRGALVCTSDATPYVVLDDVSDDPWSALYGLGSVSILQLTAAVAIGVGDFEDSGFTRRTGNYDSPTPGYLFSVFMRTGAASPVPWSGGAYADAHPVAHYFGGVVGTYDAPEPLPQGVVVTSAIFPGLFWVRFAEAGGSPPADAQQIALMLVCVGAREGTAPNTAPGLYALCFIPGTGPPLAVYACPIMRFDALGTGGAGLLSVPVADGGEGQSKGGSNAIAMWPRGVIIYNDHAFIWGYDSSDLNYGDGPNRVMFSNLGAPLKWGNDNQNVAGVDRPFTDSDAIVLGDAGEIIRGAIKWNGKLWFGTNQQLHYIGGFGRDSFLTDGATPVAKAYNIVGPYALIEGPDRKLYGVCDQGLWSTADGENYAPLFLKLVDFNQQSRGYWDEIWTDLTQNPLTYPGTTNQDLVWMAVDWNRHQVVVGIPFCSIANGYGIGNDTVVIKYNVATGGFTRQVFPGVQYTAASYMRRAGQQPDVRLLGTATVGASTIDCYSQPPSAGEPNPMPTTLPSATIGPYAPFGPNGKGVLRRAYLTLSWMNAASLPIVFQLSTTIDEAAVDSFGLTISPTVPAGPAFGDLWVDTSQTDPSIGNETSTSTIVARGGYLLKTWQSSGWVMVAGMGNQGARSLIPMGLTRIAGTWYTLSLNCTSAAGRFQIESFADNPGAGVPSA
jgi:hypothetical protein